MASVPCADGGQLVGHMWASGMVDRSMALAPDCHPRPGQREPDAALSPSSAQACSQANQGVSASHPVTEKVPSFSERPESVRAPGNALAAVLASDGPDCVAEWFDATAGEADMERLRAALSNQLRAVETVGELQLAFLPTQSVEEGANLSPSEPCLDFEVHAPFSSSFSAPQSTRFPKARKSSFWSTPAGVQCADPFSSISDIDVASAMGAEVVETRREDAQKVPVATILAQVRRICAYLESAINGESPNLENPVDWVFEAADPVRFEALSESAVGNPIVKRLRKLYLSLLCKVPNAFSCCLDLLAFLARGVSTYICSDGKEESARRAGGITQQGLFPSASFAVDSKGDEPDLRNCYVKHMALSLPPASFLYLVSADERDVPIFWEGFSQGLDALRARVSLFLPLAPVLLGGRPSGVTIMRCIVPLQEFRSERPRASSADSCTRESEQTKAGGAQLAQRRAQAGALDGGSEQGCFLARCGEADAEGQHSGSHPSPRAEISNSKFLLSTSSAILNPGSLGAYYFPFLYHLASYQIAELEMINTSLRDIVCSQSCLEAPSHVSYDCFSLGTVHTIYQSISNTLFALQAVLVSFLLLVSDSSSVSRRSIPDPGVAENSNFHLETRGVRETRRSRARRNVFLDDVSEEEESGVFNARGEPPPMLFQISLCTLTKQMIYAYSPHCVPHFERLPAQAMLKIDRTVISPMYYRSLEFTRKKAPDYVCTSSGELIRWSEARGEGRGADLDGIFTSDSSYSE